MKIAKAMAGPPVLMPIGKEVRKIPPARIPNGGGYTITLLFYPSNGGVPDIDGYSFKARIVHGEGKMLKFSGNPPFFLKGNGLHINDDGKEATARFNVMSGSPTLVMDVTAPCTIELSGSHMDKVWTINTEN